MIKLKENSSKGAYLDIGSINKVFVIVILYDIIYIYIIRILWT